jgi:DNA-binding response OmpR family regulator
VLSSARRTRDADTVIAVLEADDDESVAALLRLDGAVVRARHEDELVRLFAEVRPDLVVIHAAAVGAGASERLRGDPLMQDSLVLVVGAAGDDEERGGADAWVALPTSEREIRAAVGLLLRLARAERAAREVHGLEEE